MLCNIQQILQLNILDHEQALLLLQSWLIYIANQLYSWNCHYHSQHSNQVTSLLRDSHLLNIVPNLRGRKLCQKRLLCNCKLYHTRCVYFTRQNEVACRKKKIIEVTSPKQNNFKYKIIKDLKYCFLNIKVHDY